MRPRQFFLMILLCAGIILIGYVVKDRADKEAKPTWAPFFQASGQATQLADRAFSKILAVDVLDEKEMGDLIASQIENDSVDALSGQYVQDCLSVLAKFTRKPFQYRAFIYPSEMSNAFALPGGVVYVTRGLLKSMHSESELASVLSHEIGHIELGHCFQAVKFELMAKKIHHEAAGKLADMAIALLLRPTFSKTQENEADVYGFELIKSSSYDPKAMALAFKRLNDYYREDYDKSVIEDFLDTHPSLQLRIKKYESEALQWQKINTGQRRYIGSRNIKELISIKNKKFDEEWLIVGL